MACGYGRRERGRRRRGWRRRRRGWRRRGQGRWRRGRRRRRRGCRRRRRGWRRRRGRLRRWRRRRQRGRRWQRGRRRWFQASDVVPNELHASHVGRVQLSASEFDVADAVVGVYGFDLHGTHVGVLEFGVLQVDEGLTVDHTGNDARAMHDGGAQLGPIKAHESCSLERSSREHATPQVRPGQVESLTLLADYCVAASDRPALVVSVDRPRP